MRIPRQEIKDKAQIREFLASQRVVYLSIVDDGNPYVIPFNYGFTMDETGKMALYFHASIGGRFYDAVQKNCKQSGSARVAFCVAEMRALIAPERPCYWDCVYRSVAGEGTIELVSEPTSKEAALHVLMGCFRAKPGYKFEQNMVDRITVYKITVEDYHMKQSKPGNEDLVTSIGMMP